MRSFVVGVAASVAASAVIFLALAATDALSPFLRLVVIASLLVLGVAAAWLASRGARDGEEAGTAVGDQVDAAGDVAIERVDVKRSGGETRVGTNLKSGGTARVSDVRVAGDEDPE